MVQYQQTVKKPVEFKGIGLHSGEEITMCVFPADANEGIQFIRTDIEGNPTVIADAFNVIETDRSTRIQEGEASVQTLEHFLAALFYLGIDNAIIEIDGGEVPILDGSSKPFIDKLKATGIKKHPVEREVFNLEKTIEYRDPENDIHLIATPADHFSVFCMIDYNSKVLGKQYAELENINDFDNDIAGARTFCFFNELEYLAKNNLIKGGSLDNALVVVENRVTDSDLDRVAAMLNKPRIEVNKKGFLNNTGPAGKNEPARHKLLDVVGDLSLIGNYVNMRIIAKRPGHKANTELAKRIKKQLKKQVEKSKIPVYDVNEKPILNIEQIKEFLPHRFPFLLVDKVVQMDKEQIVGVKNITGNEDFFQGHFPNNPVFPGVLQIEALAQTGGILALNLQDDPKGWDTYFLKIDNCKFKQMVYPGDSLILKLQLTQPIRRGICVMHGEAYVGNKLVSEADLVAKIQKRP